MTKLRHTGILVKDLTTSLNLYTKVFGFKEVGRGVFKDKDTEELFNLSNMHLTWVKLKSKGCSTMLELWTIKDLIDPSYFNNLSHFALTVKDLDEIYKKLKERKLKFFSPPTNAKDSNVRLCFLKDYDNNIIELVEEKRLKS